MRQGGQIILWYNIPKQRKYMPNDHKIYQIYIKYTKLQLNASNGHKIYQHLPSKIYPNWDFWFENIPSGNPATTCPLDINWPTAKPILNS
jgi:hypothetical protein